MNVSVKLQKCLEGGRMSNIRNVLYSFGNYTSDNGECTIFLYENNSIITTGVKLRTEIKKSMCNTYTRNKKLWKYKKCNGTNKLL